MQVMQEDFYSALHRHGRDQAYLENFLQGKCKGIPTAVLPICEQLFNQHFVKASLCDHYLIPKKIHQIWLGEEMPSEYTRCTQTWAEAAGWEYRLWTDRDVEAMELFNDDLYRLGRNYGEKSDILRLEILYREGGLYVDVDAECLNIDFFDRLHRSLTFYAGFEPLEHRWLGVSNALMGVAQGHPFLQKMIVDLKAHFFAHEERWAVIKTGPVFLTRMMAVFLQETSDPKMVCFPSSYFYPASYNDVRQGNDQRFQESAALHYWGGSWV